MLLQLLLFPTTQLLVVSEIDAFNLGLSKKLFIHGLKIYNRITKMIPYRDIVQRYHIFYYQATYSLSIRLTSLNQALFFSLIGRLLEEEKLGIQSFRELS